MMTFAFTGKIWHWRGPSPFHFLTVPARRCRNPHGIVGLVRYRRDVIPVPVTVRTGASECKDV